MQDLRSKKKVLIVEDDAAIRGTLAKACEGLATPVLASDGETARDALAGEFFDLLLLDWHLEPEGGAELMETATRLQSGARRIVLFTIPSLDALVKAMQTGAHDVWWVSQSAEPHDNLLKEWLEKAPVSNGLSPLLLSRLANSMSMQAASRRSTFFEARREFSRTLIREISRRHGFSRSELARWMGVSVRTIQRLLSTDE